MQQAIDRDREQLRREVQGPEHRNEGGLKEENEVPVQQIEGGRLPHHLHHGLDTADNQRKEDKHQPQVALAPGCLQPTQTQQQQYLDRDPSQQTPDRLHTGFSQVHYQINRDKAQKEQHRHTDTQV